MAGPAQVRECRFEAPFGLCAKYPIESIEHRQQPLRVGLFPRVNDIDIKRVHRSAVQHGGQSADQNELHLSFNQRAQNWKQRTLLHLLAYGLIPWNSALSPPECPRFVPRE